MIWVFVAILILVLATLGVLDAISFSDGLQQFLLSDLWQYASFILLFLCILFYFLIIARWQNMYGRRLARVIVICAVIVLFVPRTFGVYLKSEQHTIKSRQIVVADVLIEQISDSVVNEYEDGHFRQVAILQNVQSAAKQHTQNSLLVENPFYSNHTKHSHQNDEQIQKLQLSTLNGAKVLMSISAKNPNFQSIYQKIQDIQPNTKIKAQLLITPVRQESSVSGFDTNRWLRTRGIHADAKIIQIDEVIQLPNPAFNVRLEQWRQKLRNHFYQNWHLKNYDEQQALAVSLSLLTGDRALIDKNTKDLYQLAGISHLLAISGTHVLFLAMILSFLITKMIDRSFAMTYQKLPKWQIRFLVMIFAGFLYALFTGFDIPAVRTVWMLAAVFLVRYFALPITQLTTMMAVALLMVWLDPFVLWQAAFWLSFIAVLLLMRYENLELSIINHTHQAKGMGVKIKKLCLLQIWLFFAMLPLSILLFGKVSIWGLLINLFAISFFGLIIVPLNLLAGVLYFPFSALSEILWSFSAQMLLWLHDFLRFTLSTTIGGIGAWLYAPFGILGLSLLSLMVLVFSLPKILPKYLLTLPAFLFLILVFFHPNDNNGLQIIPIKSDSHKIKQILLIHRHHHKQQSWLLLADLGVKKLPATYTQNLIDTLKKQGIGKLDGIIVQTPSGVFLPAIQSLSLHIPVHHYWQAGKHDTQGKLRHQNCQAGKTWQQNGLKIRVLTGWSQINDEKVWGCELEIVSEQPLKQLSNSSVSSNIQQTPTQLIVGMNQQKMLWQMWQLLCASNQGDLGFSPTTYQKIWLSSHSIYHFEPVIQSFDANQLMFIENLSQ